LRLRQAACHPALIEAKPSPKRSPKRSGAPISRPLDESAKVQTLLEMLEELIEEDHKALVFSQFTSFLALVREQLDQRNVQYEYLDGATPARDRAASVDRFQSDNSRSLFLISLKAGGVGLNLTAADYVFLLDPWWNPAVEAQAIDRTHRIGQGKKVFAYRIIAKDTVEERILELQKTKRELAAAIIADQRDGAAPAEGGPLSTLTREDLEWLLT
jgi:SNF2 family DNA or RNA helicase